ncbi:hypothetical protein CTI12_AA598630 [Artemisia annua]|uniref:Serine-threonine/tyrosine-protein kinase catalytic domain-containing protein n=1 Tax=Artemisia annua TaxID=35608 RepID=A0A2U1KHV1_ARTAN|nr:hypothetical protein CTI12_AA598630 [Artemisia annua]
MINQDVDVRVTDAALRWWLFIGWSVRTVEHLLLVLEWTGVDNCHIEIVSSDHNDTSAEGVFFMMMIICALYLQLLLYDKGLFIGWSVRTVEHLLLVLEWTGVDNCHIEIVSSDHNDTSAETTEFWCEDDILSEVHHPNVMAFYGVVQDGTDGTLTTITEFMGDGSLRHVLLRKDGLLTIGHADAGDLPFMATIVHDIQLFNRAPNSVHYMIFATMNQDYLEPLDHVLPTCTISLDDTHTKQQLGVVIYDGDNNWILKCSSVISLLESGIFMGGAFFVLFSRLDSPSSTSGTYHCL